MPPSSLQGQDMSVERSCSCKGLLYLCATELCSRRTIPWLCKPLLSPLQSVSGGSRERRNSEPM